MEKNGIKINAVGIWIIRFADGTLASYYGEKGKAEQAAEERKGLHGGSYVIA